MALLLAVLGFIFAIRAIFDLHGLIFSLFDNNFQQSNSLIFPLLEALYAIIFLYFFRYFLVQRYDEVVNRIEGLSGRTRRAFYRLFASKATKEEDWWIKFYPGDCMYIGNTGRCSPIFQKNYDEWKKLLIDEGFGPSKKQIDQVSADIALQKTINSFKPDDARLRLVPLPSEIIEKRINGLDLSSFQFWELDGKLVEIRIKGRGFRYSGESWELFDEIDHLTECGTPLSYFQARDKFRSVPFLTNEATYLASFEGGANN